MTKHGRRILLKTRGFLGRSVAVFAGAVMLLTNVPAVNADNADKRDRITESAEKVCQWQRDKMGISQDESIFREFSAKRRHRKLRLACHRHFTLWF